MGQCPICLLPLNRGIKLAVRVDMGVWWHGGG